MRPFFFIHLDETIFFIQLPTFGTRPISNEISMKFDLLSVQSNLAIFVENTLIVVNVSSFINESKKCNESSVTTVASKCN